LSLNEKTDAALLDAIAAIEAAAATEHSGFQAGLETAVEIAAGFLSRAEQDKRAARLEKRLAELRRRLLGRGSR
jgi:hypothetical protein